MVRLSFKLTHRILSEIDLLIRPQREQAVNRNPASVDLEQKEIYGSGFLTTSFGYCLSIRSVAFPRVSISKNVEISRRRCLHTSRTPRSRGVFRGTSTHRSKILYPSSLVQAGEHDGSSLAQTIDSAPVWILVRYPTVQKSERTQRGF